MLITSVQAGCLVSASDMYPGFLQSEASIQICCVIYHKNGDVIRTVISHVEVLTNRLVVVLEANVSQMLAKASVGCFTNILFVALFALDDVDNVRTMSVGGCWDFECSSVGMAFDSCAGLHVEHLGSLHGLDLSGQFWVMVL